MSEEEFDRLLHQALLSSADRRTAEQKRMAAEVTQKIIGVFAEAATQKVLEDFASWAEEPGLWPGGGS